MKEYNITISKNMNNDLDYHRSILEVKEIIDELKLSNLNLYIREEMLPILCNSDSFEKLFDLEAKKISENDLIGKLDNINVYYKNSCEKLSIEGIQDNLLVLKINFNIEEE